MHFSAENYKWLFDIIDWLIVLSISPEMIDKIISLFDYDNQFNEVWELKLIKFDCDLDNDLKPYEK